MSLFDKFFKPESQSAREAEASGRMLEHLKQRRGLETGKWLSLMVDPSKAIKTGPPPTIEDVDRRDVLNEAPYSPPMEAQYSPLIGAGAQAVQTNQSSQANQINQAILANLANSPAVAAGLISNDDNETVTWINRIFDQFTKLSTDFNATASGTDYSVGVQLPEITYESAHYGEAYDEHKKVELFKGHLSTAHWAMLVQGNEGKIDVYMIAADQILNFTLNDIKKSEISPFMRVASQKVDGHLRWNIDGEEISAESIPLLAKELFGDLVRISSGTMNESELFSHHDHPLRLGETVAQGYDSAQSGLAVVSSVQNQTAVDGPSSQGASDDLNKLPTWEACRKLIDTLDRDLAWVGEQQNSLEPSSEESAKLHKLSAQLRTLSGQVSMFIAENHPSPGSKYKSS